MAEVHLRERHCNDSKIELESCISRNGKLKNWIAAHIEEHGGQFAKMVMSEPQMSDVVNKGGF
jgi:hypothetical protein